ncbi:MAG: TIGR03619 family F420-dependent LLM class oxidoreductase [Solirubrobacterales bacterium]
MADAARLAEELGFANVSVSDHIICPVGPEAAGVTPVWHDWSVLSTYLALKTTRIRILACLVVPYRPVLPTAKQIATIDVVSGGRFTLAAAIGWLRQEFELLGVPREQRGEITDEYLRAMKVLWTEDEPTFAGRHVSFSNVVFEPKCLQTPHVPIWVAGGTAPGPQRRLLELGDGWMPMGGDLDKELRATIVRIKEGLSARGRDPDSATFRYTIGIGRAEPALASISQSISVPDPSTIGLDGSAGEVAEAVARYEEAGFNELAINFSGQSAGEVTEQLGWFGSEVMPLLDSSTAKA